MNMWAVNNMMNSMMGVGYYGYLAPSTPAYYYDPCEQFYYSYTNPYMAYNIGPRASYGGHYSSPFIRGVLSVGQLTGGFDLVDNPHLLDSYYDACLARHNAFLGAQRSKRLAGRGGPVDTVPQLAGNYFQNVVKPREALDRHQFLSNRELERLKKPRFRDADEMLQQQVAAIRKTYRGKPRGIDDGNNTGAEMRGRLVAALKGNPHLTTEQKVLLLRYPVKDPEDLPAAVWQTMRSELPESRQAAASNAKETFQQYVEMLRARYRSEYKGTIDSLFDNLANWARREIGHEPPKPVTEAEIENKDYTPEAAEAIRKRGFDKLPSTYDQRVRVEAPDFPTAQGTPAQKAHEIGVWYLEKLKGWKEDDASNAVQKLVKKRKYWNIPKLLEKLASDRYEDRRGTNGEPSGGSGGGAARAGGPHSVRTQTAILNSTARLHSRTGIPASRINYSYSAPILTANYLPATTTPDDINRVVRRLQRFKRRFTGPQLSAIVLNYKDSSGNSQAKAI